MNNIRQMKGKKVVQNFFKRLFFFTFLFPLFSCLLFSACTKSLTDEGFPNAYTHFNEMDHDALPLPSDESPIPLDMQLLDSRPFDYEVLQNFISSYNKNTHIRVLEYKMLANPSKRDKYEKEIQKIEQQFLNNRLSFLNRFYTDLYQKNQKDFTRRYKSHCSINIINAMKFIYAKRHQGNKGYAWFIFGDNAKHDSSSLSYKHMGGDWFKVSLDTNVVILQLDGTKKEEISIAQIVNRRLKIAIK